MAMTEARKTAESHCNEISRLFGVAEASLQIAIRDEPDSYYRDQLEKELMRVRRTFRDWLRNIYIVESAGVPCNLIHDDSTTPAAAIA